MGGEVLRARRTKHYRHCERSEAIHATLRKLDRFVAEFIIGPAKGRTRWLLAMTKPTEIAGNST
jgi:hypothetical protein